MLKELLKRIKAEIEKDIFGIAETYGGFCSYFDTLLITKHISYFEFDMLRLLLQKEAIKKKLIYKEDYLFKPYNWQARIEFLESKIKELENQ